MRKSNGMLVLGLAAALAGAGCDSLNPLSSSGDDSPVVHGRVVGLTSSGVPGQVSAMSNAADVITVRVVEVPTRTVRVASDGTFTLRGLPAGTFTLIFLMNGEEIGRETFSDVEANQEITITIELVDGEVSIVDEIRVDVDPTEPANGEKATICHMPPGNPDNAHTLQVGASAVPAHLAHGDTMGACSGSSARNKDKEDKGNGKDKDKDNKGNNGNGKKK